MVYSSVIFLLLFLPLVLLAYYVVPHSKKNIVALLASLLFYFWGAPKFFMLLIPLLIVNFYIVQKISTSTKRLLQKKLLWLSLSINLGVLAYFKYANFFVENVNEFFSLFGVQSLSWVEVMLPIGISFFTIKTPSEQNLAFGAPKRLTCAIEFSLCQVPILRFMFHLFF